MHVPRWLVVPLGVASLWPIAYMVIFFATVFSTLFGGERLMPETFFTSLFVAHVLTMLLIVGLLIFYVVHLFKSPDVPNDRRALWAIVLFMGSIVAFPIYWYYYVRTPATTDRAV